MTAMNILTTAISLLLSLSSVPAALEPPGEGSSGFSKSLSTAKVNEALELGNHLVSPDLVADLRNRLSQTKSITNSAFSRRRGLPAQGNPKMLVLLIEFAEYPHKDADTAEVMRDKIFNSGSYVPYESLSAYYRRSSYGKLNIEGNVLGWYNAGWRSDVPETGKGREELVRKAIQNYPDHDFSQYDNNNDGTVDYFAVIWTGPAGEWATFWWGLKLEFSDKGFEAGGKKLGSYSWQYEAD